VKRFITYISAALALALPRIILAADPITTGVCQAQTNSTDPNCTQATPVIIGQGGFITNIIGVMIYAVGAISVIMLIIGGMRYALSGGDSAGIKSAKDTILYALVGLVVSILAFVIVQFIIGKVG
jgi:hypothetical protein